MKNKKSTVAVDVMIYMAIGVIVFLVLVFIVPRLLGKGSEQTCGLLGSSNDEDGDGIMNNFDKCACEGPNGKEEFDGCETKDKYKTYTAADKKDCKDKIEADCKKTT